MRKPTEASFIPHKCVVIKVTVVSVSRHDDTAWRAKAAQVTPMPSPSSPFHLSLVSARAPLFSPSILHQTRTRKRSPFHTRSTPSTTLKHGHGSIAVALLASDNQIKYHVQIANFAVARYRRLPQNKESFSNQIKFYSWALKLSQRSTIIVIRRT